jgi:predicted Zn-dependent peptidase
MSAAFHHSVLANGLHVVAETWPQARSAAFGFFVRTGSRDEPPAWNGVSHFLEHMAFKGTERYSAEDVNRIFDEIGAVYNASTSEETTLFYAAVLPEYLPTAFALLADLMQPAIRVADFELEKQVILEEIGMYDDQPSYVAYDHAMQRHFAGHPLGQNVLGSRDTVSALTAEQMRAYHAERYAAGNIVLAVAGRVDWSDVLKLAEQHCGRWRAGSPPRVLTEPVPQPSRLWLPRPQQQQEQIVALGPAPSATDPLRYAAEILAVLVGDDHNSRLYWELVDPGWADTADLGIHEFEGVGSYLTMLAGEPEETAKNLARVQQIFDDVNRFHVTAEELELAKTKVATRLVLQGERPMGRLSQLGHDWLIRREYRSVADDLAILERVTLDDIEALLDRYPLTLTTVVGVGPLSGL